MLPRRERLSTDALSRFRGGKRIASKHFSAVALPEGRGCAVVVSKKTARLAPTRHRMKRRVMAALRGLPRPRALILYPRSEAARIPFSELKADLALLLSKISGGGVL